MADTAGAAALAGTHARAGPMLKRLLTAVMAIPIVVLLVTRGPWWAIVGVVTGLAALGAWELSMLVRRGGRPVYRWPATVLAAAVTASFTAPFADPILVFTIAAAVTLALPVLRSGEPSVEPAAWTLLAIVYLGWPLGYALQLYARANGPWLIVYLLVITWTGESAAYFVGSLLGRRALAPRVSPRKTVEGAVAQLVASAVAAVVAAPWLVPELSVSAAVGGGLVLGVVGQIGDLVESVIKRTMGAKDAGTMFPGHGGILDRIDGLLFNVPAFFYYAGMVGGRP